MSLGFSSKDYVELSQVRMKLGTPVPRVHAWSSRAQSNAVGAEYIIMEKLSGVPLDTVWAEMEIQDRFTVVKAIARYQKAWMSCTFRQFGSLYFSKDLDGSGQSFLYTICEGVELKELRFAVGPSTGRSFSDDGRSMVEFDKRPCKTLSQISPPT